MGANFFPSVKVGMMETSSPHVDDNNFNPWQAQASEFRQSSDQHFPKKIMLFPRQSLSHHSKSAF